MRVLVSAYGCEPVKGSEQGVGWHWALEFARTHDVWVLTRANNRRAIEAAVPPALAGRLRFVYYDLPGWIGWAKRGPRGLYPAYALWQLGAYRVAARLARRIRFDVCLHLTFGSLWMPTWMHRLPVPFVWGPVGGGESVPFRFWGALPWFGRLSELARWLLIRSARVNPFVRGPAGASRLILARTEETARALPAIHARKVRVLGETGMPVAPRAGSAGRPEDGGLELLYTGRLVAKKNVAMAIRALALLGPGEERVRLTIAGDGPLRPGLERLARRLGVAGRVRFLGALGRRDVEALLAHSHVFVFPGLIDGGSWSLLEAMAAGLPVICMEAGGTREITDEGCAIRVALTDPRSATRAMADGMSRLAASRRLREAMGERARRRVTEVFSWPARMARMSALLAEAGLAPAPGRAA